jgi:hypothetical protein
MVERQSESGIVSWMAQLKRGAFTSVSYSAAVSCYFIVDHGREVFLLCCWHSVFCTNLLVFRKVVKRFQLFTEETVKMQN